MSPYFVSNRQSWFELDGLNLSGTAAGGTQYDIPTVGTWLSVAKFSGDEIDLSYCVYRSSIQEDGQPSLFVSGDPTGTSYLNLRILPPGKKIGLSVLNNIGFLGTSQLSTTQVEFSPARNIPAGSLLQAHINPFTLQQFTGTNNKLYLQFNFTSRGSDSVVTSLLDF
jgi:hypothetical protein